MESRFSNEVARRVSLAGAVAWLVLAVAWQASSILDQGRDWEGLPQAAFLLGAVGLLIGGLALIVVALNPTGPAPRPWLRAGGLVLLAVGLVVTVIAGWAVPIWTAALGLAMLALASSGALRSAGWIIGTALTAASASWFILSALEVGTADSYGDYPIAWTAATWIAAVGSASGLVWWSRSLQHDTGTARVSQT